MPEQALAVDIGTSGIRAQLLDLDTRRVVRTCITTRNPIPGANIMDHMSFAIQYGEDLAHSLIADACRQLVSALKPDRLVQMAVCGNPIQLSLFEGIGISDETNWTQMAKFHAEWSKKFYDVFVPLLQQWNAMR